MSLYENECKLVTLENAFVTKSHRESQRVTESARTRPAFGFIMYHLQVHRPQACTQDLANSRIHRAPAGVINCVL